MVFLICIFTKKMRLPQTREVWPIFDQNLHVVTLQNRPYLKIFRRIKKKLTDDVKFVL